MVTDLAGNVHYNNDVVGAEGTSVTPFRFRRSSSRMSSYSLEEPEPIRISGEATLCFENNGQSFLGVINSVDDNYYSIHGKKFNRIPEGSPECDCSSSDSSDDEETLPLLFNIRIKDHDDPTEYLLKEVHVHLGRDCKFKRSNISFSSANSYRGHKAQLIAQSCLGRGVLADSDLRVYSGHIEITVLEKRVEPRHWVL